MMNSLTYQYSCSPWAYCFMNMLEKFHISSANLKYFEHSSPNDKNSDSISLDAEIHIFHKQNHWPDEFGVMHSVAVWFNLHQPPINTSIVCRELIAYSILSFNTIFCEHKTIDQMKLRYLKEIGISVDLKVSNWTLENGNSLFQPMSKIIKMIHEQQQ